MDHTVKQPAAVIAADAAPRTKPSNYPEPFASRMAGRIKRPLGDLFGLSSFGVNLTRLPPGAVSALHHQHSRQDEFIYVLEGEPTLFTDAGETQLRPGMVAGFAASGTAHHLENRTERDCVILEVGDRAQGDEVRYPTDDIQAVMGDDGKWRFAHKDGTKSTRHSPPAMRTARDRNPASLFAKYPSGECPKGRGPAMRALSAHARTAGSSSSRVV